MKEKKERKTLNDTVILLITGNRTQTTLTVILWLLSLN